MWCSVLQCVAVCCNVLQCVVSLNIDRKSVVYTVVQMDTEDMGAVLLRSHEIRIDGPVSRCTCIKRDLEKRPRKET